MVIGCCGAGKSTFSRKLNSILNTELIHLDQYYWKPNWEESDSEEWSKKVIELANKSEWIIDGNYSGTMKYRIEKADTIIFLDYPTWRCLWRVLKRTVKYYGKERPDMPIGCKERFSFEFIHYVAMFNFLKRKSLINQLEPYKKDKRIEIIKSDQEAERFLKNFVR